MPQLVRSCFVLLALPSIAVAFMWGAATASFQIEGGVDHDGRLPSVWDEFSHTPGKILNGDVADIAVNGYHRFRDDARLAKKMGLTAYRFSIAWPRVLPLGRGARNQRGIDHYNQVIDYLIELGITPLVTLFHWDTPLALERELGGWLSPAMPELFADYASLCFQLFGDRVKHWITINEPKTLALCGYSYGNHAPGRCSDRRRCAQGNSTAEPLAVGHHLLLAHAAAAGRYRAHFQGSQRGRVSISLNSDYAYPLRPDSEADIAAAQRNLEFSMGWFADPIFFGRYPAAMTERIPGMPVFSREEQRALLHSIDFFALNSYTAKYVSSSLKVRKYSLGDYEDTSVRTEDAAGKLIGPQSGSFWLQSVPSSILDMLLWVSERYNYPTIIITENGVSDPGDQNVSLKDAINDTFRKDYLEGYLGAVLEAKQRRVKVDGYFIWSLMDNFEWSQGYSERFGLVYVDRANGLRRKLKSSAFWLKDYIATNSKEFLAQ